MTRYPAIASCANQGLARRVNQAFSSFLVLPTPTAAVNGWEVGGLELRGLGICTLQRRMGMGGGWVRLERVGLVLDWLARERCDMSELNLELLVHVLHRLHGGELSFRVCTHVS